MLILTYDPTVFALKCGAGTRDGPTGAGAAEGGPAGRAVEGGAWAVGAGRCCAAGQRGARADALASHRALGGNKKEVRYKNNVLHESNMSMKYEVNPI